MATTQVGVVLKHLRRVLGGPGTSPTEDDELLQRFLLQRDESAFTALVERYGPLVLRVCRNILQDPHDAEDAFQATFLVFVRKAGAISRPHLLGPWLHGVAYRVAVRARAQAARRRHHERQAQVMPTSTPVPEIDWRELGPVIEEEIHRLPEKYRVPFVLCCLQGKTNEQAAQHLGCPTGTILSRLSRGRERLRSRLTKRGVTLSAALFSMALATASASAAVPQQLVASTVKAGLLFGAGVSAAGVSTTAATLAKEVTGAMFFGKVKTAALLLLAIVFVGVSAVLGHFAANSEPEKDNPPPVVEPRDRPPIPPAVADNKDKPPAQPPVPRDLFGDPLPPRALARLGSLRFRHGSLVSLLAFFPDGKKLVYGGEGGVDNVLRVADVDSGKELQTFALRAYEMAIRMALSADGKTLAAAIRSHAQGARNGPGTVALWDTRTGKELRRLSEPAGEVRTLAFHPDGKLLLTVAGKDRIIHAWDPDSGRQLPLMIEPGSGIGALAFSADGKLLAISSSQDNRKSIFLWETEPWRELRRLAHDLPNSPTLEDILAFSPDGKLLAGVDFGQGARLWNTATGEASAPLRPKLGGIVVAIRFSPDGKTLAVAQHHPTKGLTLWDVATRTQVHALLAHGSGTRAMAFAPARPGQPPLIATGGTDNTVQLWDAALGTQHLVLQGHAAPVDTVALLADGKALTVSRDEKSYRLWDPLSGRELSRGFTGDKRVGMALVAPMARLLAVTQYEKLPATFEPIIRLIDVVAGKEVRRLEGENSMRPIAFTPDGQTLAAAEGTQSVVIWDASAAKVRRRIDLDKLMAGSFSRPTAALTPDGKRLALRVVAPGGGRADRTSYLGIWDTTTGQEQWCVPTSPWETDSLAFSPDGKVLAEGRPGSIRLWDSDTGKELHKLDCHMPDESTYAGYPERLAFTPDGKTLIAGNGGNRVFLWDVATGAQRRQFIAHRGRVFAVSVSPDGTMLATASQDTTALIWDLRKR